MRTGICGVEAHRLGKLLDCFGEPMRLRKNTTHFEIGHWLIGFDGQREPEFLQRFLRQSLPGKNHA